MLKFMDTCKGQAVAFCQFPAQQPVDYRRMRDQEKTKTGSMKKTRSCNYGSVDAIPGPFFYFYRHFSFKVRFKNDAYFISNRLNSRKIKIGWPVFQKKDNCGQN